MKNLCIPARSWWALGLLVGFCLSGQSSQSQQVPLDRSLGSELEGEESNIFKDMGVVQRRAMPKSGRFLMANYMALDFSDGPYTLYSFNVNPGFAVSDFFEIYINTAPFFVSNPRSIVGKLEALDGLRQTPFTSNLNLTIDSIKPKYQYGLEFLWAPLYGKDSLGTQSVIRSDTFFKFGASQIVFINNQKGLKFHGGIGKTFFVTRWLGLRFNLSGVYQETIIATGDETNLSFQKTFGLFGFVEAGPVFYF